jgi:hypothetical protein
MNPICCPSTRWGIREKRFCTSMQVPQLGNVWSTVPWGSSLDDVFASYCGTCNSSKPVHVEMHFPKPSLRPYGANLINMRNSAHLTTSYPGKLDTLRLLNLNQDPIQLGLMSILSRGSGRGPPHRHMKPTKRRFRVIFETRVRTDPLTDSELNSN